jgi:hypothetical protein
MCGLDTKGGWCVYVDGSSNSLVRFVASNDSNKRAKNLMVQSLRYGKADVVFTVPMETSQTKRTQMPSRRLAVREMAELHNPTMERLERARKIYKRDVNYNFLYQFPDFNQFFVYSIGYVSISG